jgi:hypothetical protein
MATATHKPKWLRLTDKLLPVLVSQGSAHLDPRRQSLDPNLAYVPYGAFLHWCGSLDCSMYANERGLHAVAIAVTRQCLESLSLVTLGLWDDVRRRQLLEKWRDGKLSPGELRHHLERHIWPAFRPGLWSEPWSEFFANLCRAIQPYSHYTAELSGWQWQDLAWSWSGVDAPTGVTTMGPQTYDPLKASRVTLLHALLTWTLRRLFTDMTHVLSPVQRAAVDELGKSLGRSKLLFKKKDWALELAPHVVFREGAAWLDE